MTSVIGWVLGLMLLACNVVAALAVARARQDRSREHLEKMANRCRHGLRAVSAGFLIVMGHAMWGIWLSLSASTEDEEATLLGAAISDAMDHTLLLLLGVLIPSAAIIYFNVLLRRAIKDED